MEAQKMFEVGQFWKDNDGDKHLICDIDSEYIYTFSFSDKQVYCFDLNGIAPCVCKEPFLSEPWKEPISGEVLVNVYRTGDEIFYLAEENGHYVPLPSGRNLVNAVQLARIKMPWKEGQFDD